MKLVITTVVFLLLSLCATAQTGCVAYAYKIPSPKNLIKTAHLYFDAEKSLFVYNMQGVTMEKAAGGATSDGNGISLNFVTGDEVGTRVYRDFTRQQMVERHAKGAFPAYTVEESWVQPEWKILKKKKTIGSFTCTKATGSFRGNTFTAWFTEEIPLPYGPWKLAGLPGLILEAEDEKGLLRATLESVDVPCSDPLVLETPTADESKTLREQVDFMDNYHVHMMEMVKSKLPRNMANQISNPRSDASSPRQYRAEKIFEWETKEPK